MMLLVGGVTAVAFLPCKSSEGTPVKKDCMLCSSLKELETGMKWYLRVTRSKRSEQYGLHTALPK